MKIVFEKEKFVYYFAFFLLCFITLADNSRLININNSFKMVSNILISIIFLLKIFKTNYTFKQLMVIAIIGVIVMFIVLQTRNYVFFVNYIAMISLINIKLINIIKVDIFVKVLFLFTNVLVYSLDYFPTPKAHLH